MDDRAIGRRAFLGLVGTGLLGLFFARDLTEGIRKLTPTALDGALPATSGWRIFTVGATMPNIAAHEFRLDVSGLVDRPTSLTLDELKAIAPRKQISDFSCVTGWRVEDVRWEGVRVADLLEHVGTRMDANAVRFISAEEPYDDSLTREQASMSDVILAWQMDGNPLPRPHGGPLRLIVPAMYGYKSVKWVTRIVVEDRLRPGYWEQRGYDADAWIGRSNGL